MICDVCIDSSEEHFPRPILNTTRGMRWFIHAFSVCWGMSGCLDYVLLYVIYPVVFTMFHSLPVIYPAVLTMSCCLWYALWLLLWSVILYMPRGFDCVMLFVICPVVLTMSCCLSYALWFLWHISWFRTCCFYSMNLVVLFNVGCSLS